VTEQNGSDKTPGGSPDPRQTGNRYDATAAAERRRDPSGAPSDQAMAEAIGAGSPQDVGQSTRASTHGPIKQTVGEGRPESGDVTFPAFDDHHPPDKGLIDDCVHCGFCLPTCPTYVLFGEEMDSPRGRIYLMNKGLNEESMNDTMVRHFDLCLGCMACVTACPSGVQYDKLIEATRAQVERRYERAPENKGCCGALSTHAGREEESLRFARKTIDTFEKENLDNVVVNAAGCGSTMKDYAYLLRDDPEYAERAQAFSDKVKDVSEFLQELGTVAERHPLPITAAYHDACHLGHAQGGRQQPRQVLKEIPGMEIKEIQEAEVCCGSAGIYNMVEPEPAAELGERKASNILKTGAQLIITSNPGCTLQLQASLKKLGNDIPIAHPAAVLDASIRGEPVESLLGG